MFNVETLNEARSYHDPSQDSRLLVTDLGLAGFGLEIGDTLIVQPMMGPASPGAIVLVRQAGRSFTLQSEGHVLAGSYGLVIGFIRRGFLFCFT